MFAAMVVYTETLDLSALLLAAAVVAVPVVIAVVLFRMADRQKRNPPPN
jgi:hypothetical protein